MALSHVMNLVSNSGLVVAAGGSGSGGGGGNNDSQTVTVGTHTITVSPGNGLPTNTSYYHGFLVYGSTTYGSISDGTSNIYSGAAYNRIMYFYNDTYPTSGVNLWIAGTNKANSGWTTLTIGSTAYARTDATYNASGGGASGDTTWTWTEGQGTAALNPFSGTGTATTCVFT